MIPFPIPVNSSTRITLITPKETGNTDTLVRFDPGILRDSFPELKDGIWRALDYGADLSDRHSAVEHRSDLPYLWFGKELVEGFDRTLFPTLV